MLTKDQKNKLIDKRLEEYDIKLFMLEMDKKALESIGDMTGIETLDKRVESFKKAYKVVESMKEE